MVSIPMVSSLSSRLNFYDESGTRIACPIEGRQCQIFIDVPQELFSEIALLSGTVSLPVLTDSAGMYAYSIWPASPPGYYALSLFCGDIRENQTVAVIPEFFSETDFTAMINDLTVMLPNSIAMNLQYCGAQLGIVPSEQQRSSIEEEWFRLQSAIRGTQDKLGLLQVLPLIERECNQILLPQLEVRPTDKMRRPEMSRLPQAISMPGNMVELDKLYQMFDTTFKESFETYENQLVKTYVQALRSQLSRLQDKVRREAAPPAMANEIEMLSSEFRLACMRATFLSKVKRSIGSADRVTMVLLKNPAYRTVFEGYLALNQQSSITLEEQALTAPLNKLPFLYQRWVNLRVFNALLQTCAELGFQCVSHHWVKSYRKGAFIHVTNDGQAAVQLVNQTTGTVVNLIPWRPIHKNENSAQIEAPIALAVAIEAPGKPLIILVFDSKYKVALKSSVEPLKEDVDEFLLSVESLKQPGNEQQIQYAALLYPGQNMQIAPGVEALSAHPAYGDAVHNAICTVLKRFLS
ncbi:MAG: DUF2357 domain-containing protein [Candidatus Melainabacteria bacterium]|nr:MAG: DUF2357 domain-containing protein [Candidatus Melainabacteria bacterium]